MDNLPPAKEGFTLPHKSDMPLMPEAGQRLFFEQSLQAALRAEARAGTVERHYDVAGTRLRVVFAGPVLDAAFRPALAHIEVPAGPAEATFHVWDTETTGVAMVPPPRGQEYLTDRGDIWGMSGTRYRFAFHWSEYSVNAADPATGESVYWVRSASHLPYWAKASPMRTLFHWLMESRGRQLLHAAAVGGDEGAVLITGRGGAGKSTTAIACLAAGMHYIADDYLIVEPGDPPNGEPPRAVSLYATAKLNHDRIGMFSDFHDLIVNRDTPANEKVVLDLYPARAAQLARALPIRAVLTPAIMPRRETRFAPISRDTIRQAASFTTMSQLPYAGEWTHSFIDTLIGAVPSLTIELGDDLDGVTHAIRRLLAMSRDEIDALTAKETARVAWPLISVIIPVYNGAGFLPEAIANVLSQDYPSLEIIIVDDGSTDAIEAAVAALPVDVRFLRQTNEGPASARNRGIRDAVGSFIAFLDVDDLWPAGTLRTLAQTLAGNPAVQVARGYAQVAAIGADGTLEYLGNPKESFSDYIGAGLYRREVFETAGLFDHTLRFGEDFEWYARAGDAAVEMARLDQSTLLVRRHDRNMTRGRTATEMNHLRVLRKMIGRRRKAASPNA